MTLSDTRVLLVGLFLCGLAVGCSPGDSERCDAIDDILISKSQQFPLRCEEDIDCVLVDDISPNGPTVSNGTPADDPELNDLRLRRIELCGEFPERSTVYQALCVNDACELRATGTIRPDAGSGEDTDVPDGDCACAVDSDCASGESCVGECTCNGVCNTACDNVDSCGLLLSLGLGTSVENCIALCNADVEVNGNTLALCLGSLSCDLVSTCF